MAHHHIPPPRPSPCPECGTQRQVAEGLNTVRLVPVDTRFTGFTSRVTELWALVCPACGLTTLYAKDPYKVLQNTGDR